MKFEKAEAEVVLFDQAARFMTVSMGGWTCEEVRTLGGDEVIEIAGDGHGACSGFSYDPNKTYYSCMDYVNNGYPAHRDCAVVVAPHCYVVS